MNAKVMWIGIVVGLLALSLIAHGILLFAAISDPSFAIVPDYEEKAANWNAIQAERWAGERLGWTVDLHTSAGTLPGTVDVSLTLQDSDGTPIEDATIDLRGFHNARASHTLEARLRAKPGGGYTTTLPIRRSGIWQFEVIAVRGEDRLVRTMRKTVRSAMGRPASQDG